MLKVLMTTETNSRILDFGKTGMWWEITRSTAESAGECFEAINVINADFGGPPVHAHPHAEESYQVIEGALDVFVDGAWRTLKAGESATVPAGMPHTLRNSSGAQVRLLNKHAPALDFERFFRRMHAMAASGQVALPPRGFGALVRISMLFVEHEREIVSVKPPRAVMRTVAMLGRWLGYKLPA
jgi:mannose-6-phosphate isomerase-like protein (cupin superfamily)